MPASGHFEPTSFVAGTAELASIADGGEASGPSTVRPHYPGDSNDRTPRLTGAAPAPGQLQTLAPQQANARNPFIITRTCRPAYRAYWQLNANQLSSDNDAKSLDSGT
jgi:hypothetical protein